ncbi:response regulator [Parvularcula oceani]|uniref:response regulator n=1 Tax=Parvularcula oceani TaxID=1247963 RepID=UPI000566E5BF|nr:response regulator [Parvularcula oceani]
MASCLVVDDSAVVCGIAADILRAFGHEVTEARTAEAAITRCKDGVDVVLLDWDLPSLGALDFLREAALLAEERRPAIILCASENDPRQFSLARAAGAAYHVLKPFDRDDLAEVMRKAGFDAPKRSVA